MMRSLNRGIAIGLLLVCFTASADERVGEITPQQLFAGHSEGNGSLKFLFGERKTFHVESSGQMQPNGKFRLDQTITFDGEKAKSRHWILETIAANAYAGTLSDAAGDVTGRTEGNRLTLRYRAKGPMVMHQTLDLLSDGKTIDNTGKITLLGIAIGRLHETIIRRDPVGQYTTE